MRSQFHGHDVARARLHRSSFIGAALALVLGGGLPAAEPPIAAGTKIEVHSDLSYAGNDNPQQTLDLYLPLDRVAERRLPVVVYIHGGGWQRGSKSAGKAWVQPLVDSGHYAGVAINYRLAGEAKWPAPIHDCKAAVRWIRANAARHGLDPDRIGVAGASSGGTLATLLGTSGDVPALDGEVGPHRREPSRVTCVVNLYGRMNFLAEPESARAAPAQAAALAGRLALLFGGSVEEKSESAREASPLTHLSANDPPIFTIHGTMDPTVPYVQALELDAALKRLGRPHWLLTMTGFGHGFQQPEANRRARQFFDRHLRGQPVEISLEPIVAPPKTRRP